MNTQFESKADGPRRTTPRMTKTFCDILSDSLPEPSQTRNSTRIRIKFLKETGSHYNPIRTRRLNPTRSRLLRPLQKRNCSPQRSNNSQKTKNYRSNRAFHSRKTMSIQKLAATIAKFSWLSFRTLLTEKLIPQHWKT